MREEMKLPGLGSHWIWIPVRWFFWSGISAFFWAGALWTATSIR